MREIFENLDKSSHSDPQKAAQTSMRPILPKRFYENATVGHATGEGDSSDTSEAAFCILLDGKKVKTPARNTLLLPTERSALIVADEWQAQKEFIDATTMPATRLVNTACDGIVTDPQAVIEDMLKFASSDLLCYRATTPPGLVERQMQQWDPVLDWIESEMGARFETTQALIQIAQPKEAVAAIAQTLRQWQHPIAIAALHTFTNLTGSVILALAIAKESYSASQAWEIAHVDEDWNNDHWGDDEEAQRRRANRWKELEAADKLFKALRETA